MRMSASCPACGVAVVPGYVRCPKCHRTLGAKHSSTVAGGTAVSGAGGLPLLPMVGGGIVLFGVVLFLALRGTDKPAAVAPGDPTQDPIADPSEAPSPNLVPAIDEPERDPNRIDPNRMAQDLERTLKTARLWSTVEVVGSNVEIRSGSCRDANMIPAVDTARTALRNAGLTKLRCLENSGAVVFEREL